MLNKFYAKNGFTLIESIVALAIVSICLAGIFSLLPASNKLLTQTNLQETARNLATAQIEYIKNLNYDSSSQPLSYAAVELSTKYPNFSVQIDAIRIHPAGSTNFDDGVQKITVTIFQGSTQITTLEGYKAAW